MGRGYRRADIGRQVDPDRRRHQGRHHRPDEDIAVADLGGIDNALGNGGHHVATGKDGTGTFENGRDDQRADKRQRAGPHGRADIIGDVVGANIKRHVPAQDGGNDDNERVRSHPRVETGKKAGHAQEHQRQAVADDVPGDGLGRGLDLDQLGQVLIEGLLAKFPVVVGRRRAVNNHKTNLVRPGSGPPATRRKLSRKTTPPG